MNFNFNVGGESYDANLSPPNYNKVKTQTVILDVKGSRDKIEKIIRSVEDIAKDLGVEGPLYNQGTPCFNAVTGTHSLEYIFKIENVDENTYKILTQRLGFAQKEIDKAQAEMIESDAKYMKRLGLTQEEIDKVQAERDAEYMKRLEIKK